MPFRLMIWKKSTFSAEGAAGTAGRPPFALVRLAAYGAGILIASWLTTPAHSQSPSSLQEWQYSRGYILLRLFDSNPPEQMIMSGLAAQRAPLSDGSASYRTRMGPVFEYRYKDIAFVSLGDGAGVNILRGGHYEAGVSLTYDLGRNSSSDSKRLRGFPDVQPSPVFKVFASYVVSRAFPLVIRADLRKFVGGPGALADLGAYIPLPGSTQRMSVFIGPSVTWADHRRAVRSFSVSSLEAKGSGYRAFDAQAGTQAAGIGLSVSRVLTSRWLLNLDAAVNRLYGSAAASPQTQERVQHVETFSITYSW
jgi:outer membrane scaffolding protein for murein synthesis (MipA/OmpV family)